MIRVVGALPDEVSTSEMAAQLGITQVAVCNMVRRGEVAAHRNARGRYRIPAAEIERVLASRPENEFLPPVRYDLDTKAKLRDLAEYEGCSMIDVMRALIQQAWQRTIGER